MFAGLGHLDLGPVIYGVVIFIGIASMFKKLITFQLFSFVVEVFVFVLVFKLHGGTMQGGFAATIAALLAGVFLPRMVK